MLSVAKVKNQFDRPSSETYTIATTFWTEKSEEVASSIKRATFVQSLISARRRNSSCAILTSVAKRVILQHIQPSIGLRPDSGHAPDLSVRILVVISLCIAANSSLAPLL